VPEKLADDAQVNARSITDFERDAGRLSLLEDAGVVFIDPNGGGVRRPFENGTPPVIAAGTIFLVTSGDLAERPKLHHRDERRI
jgi:hypothetical protein